MQPISIWAWLSPHGFLPDWRAPKRLNSIYECLIHSGSSLNKPARIISHNNGGEKILPLYPVENWFSCAISLPNQELAAYLYFSSSLSRRCCMLRHFCQRVMKFKGGKKKKHFVSYGPKWSDFLGGPSANNAKEEEDRKKSAIAPIFQV